MTDGELIKQNNVMQTLRKNTILQKKTNTSRAVAKSELKASKKNLRKAYLTDEGERISKSGKSIHGVSYKNAIRQMENRYVSKRAIHEIWKRYSNSNVGYLSAKSIDLGSKAISAVMMAKTMSDVSKLNAYEKYGSKRKW